MSERMTPEQRKDIRYALGDGSKTWSAHTVRTLLNELTAVEAERDEARRWKEAVEDAAVVSWTLSEANENDPRKAINDLLCCAQDMALDPLVSETAKKWQDQLASARTVIEGLADDLRRWIADGAIAALPGTRTHAALAAASAWLAGQKGADHAK